MLYKPKFILNKECLREQYFVFIHSYLSYANKYWASTNTNKLKKLYNKQKHATRIICNEDSLTHSNSLVKSLKMLNLLTSKYISNLTFMEKNKAKRKSKIIFTNISTYNT